MDPLLFSIYMLPIGNIIRSHGIHFHCYADDTQLYIPLKPGVTGNMSHLLSCLSEITPHPSVAAQVSMLCSRFTVTLFCLPWEKFVLDTWTSSKHAQTIQYKTT